MFQPKAQGKGMAGNFKKTAAAKGKGVSYRGGKMSDAQANKSAANIKANLSDKSKKKTQVGF